MAPPRKQDYKKDETQVIQGKRGDDFKNFLKSLVDKGNISDRYSQALFTPQNMKLYDAAFTTYIAADKMGNPKDNYEFYEFAGDSVVNSCIVFYMMDKFPQICTAEGVQILSRLKIKYTSKKTFFMIAERLGFWDYITATEQQREHLKKSLLEDTLEAFFGVTSILLDDIYRKGGGKGVGYSTVYEIIRAIYNEMVPIQLTYESLYDAKSRLKEIFDKRQDNIKYVCTREENPKDDNYSIFICSVIWGNMTLSTKTASIKHDAEENAAEEALKVLRNRFGIYRDPPAIFTSIL